MLAGSALCDTVFLKSGLAHHGKVREMTDDTILFTSNDGEKIKIRVDKAESIVFSEFETGIVEGIYRNFKFDVAFAMPADFWHVKEGDLKDGWLMTLSKRKEIR
ncbi:MAG: hypothetical protein PHQ23_08185, partial [Candidatus Wallbacteria bacterium]|nr:hypothetical protein [Candidatus Wallbacteria bacterium]